jgi:O-antigen/teichoic acid export membrane protein
VANKYAAKLNRMTLGYVALSGLASALNYITYPVLAHLLPSEQYVNTTVALSLLTQMSTFLSSIVAISIGLAKERSSSDTEDKVELLQSWLFRLFTILVVLFVALSPLLMPAIKVPVLFAIPIGLLMLVSLPIAVVSGFLNGRAEMIKLGIVSTLSAGIELIMAVIIAVISKNGLGAMLAMAAGQLTTVALIYYLFRKDGVPRLSKAVKLDRVSGGSDNRRFIVRLMTYTFVSALAIMLINISQIADLLIIKAGNGPDVHFYTNIYVISRVVFFGGMIFVWPFLAEIDIRSHRQNFRPLARLITYFALIALAAIAGVCLLGDTVMHWLFGGVYELSRIRIIGTLSILYKLEFLLITAVLLYFTVLRSYKAVWLGASIAIAILVFSWTPHFHESVQSILIGLNLVAIVGVIGSLILFGLHHDKSETV